VIGELPPAPSGWSLSTCSSISWAARGDEAVLCRHGRDALYNGIRLCREGIAELQEARVIPLTVIEGAPRIPVLGIYPTLESLLVQGLLLVLALIAAGWALRPKPSGRAEGDLLRSQ